MTATIDGDTRPAEEDEVAGPLQASDTQFVHVTVWADTSSYDLELHLYSPIVEVIPDAIEQMIASLDADGKSSRWLRATGVQWCLAKGATGTMLDSSTTLEDAGIEFGNTLHLRKRRRTEGPPMWRDDVAQGAAEVSKQHFELLEPADTRRMAVLGYPLAVLALVILGAVSLRPLPESRWVSVGVLAFLAFVSAAVATVLYRSYVDAESPGEKYTDVAASLTVTTYFAAVGAAFLAVPRDVGIWHVAVAGAALLGVAIAMSALTVKRPAGVHIGAGAAGAVLALVGCLHLVVPISGQAAAALVMWLSGLVIMIAAGLSRSTSGVELQQVAATGEPLVRDENASVVAVSRKSTSSQAIEDMINSHAKVVVSFQSLVGLMVAMSVLLPIASAFAGAQTRQYEWYLFGATLGIAAATFAFGRTMALRAASVPPMIAGPLMWISYLVGRALSDTAIPMAVLAAGAGIFAVVTYVAATGAIARKKIKSPITKKNLTRIAQFGGLVALPLIGFICEIWRIRNH